MIALLDALSAGAQLVENAASMPDLRRMLLFSPEVTNLEKNYLIRIFRQYMNATPYQYVKKYRFSIALSLIKRNHPLSEVALQIGYSDIASFSHAFKKNYGISPSEVIGSSTE